MDSEDGWVGLGAVGRQLSNLASDFDPRNVRVRELSDLVRKTDAFEVDQQEGRNMRIRVKPGRKSATRKRKS